MLLRLLSLIRNHSRPRRSRRGRPSPPSRLFPFLQLLFLLAHPIFLRLPPHPTPTTALAGRAAVFSVLAEGRGSAPPPKTLPVVLPSLPPRLPPLRGASYSCYTEPLRFLACSTPKSEPFSRLSSSYYSAPTRQPKLQPSSPMAACSAKSPATSATSPDGRFVVFLHSGFGSYDSDRKHDYQSLSVLNVASDALTDFPDERLDHNARQTYFLGLVFSLDGKHLYASMASYTDPLGKKPGSSGNGIAVYSFDGGKITPEKFLPI